MERKTYGKETLKVLLRFDWSELGSWYELRDDGVWWVPPTGVWPASSIELAIRMKHPAGDCSRPALPFPFTAGEFVAFCDVHPTFAWDYIDGPYSNDDDSLDEAALAELAQTSTPAVELARAWLTRSSGTSVNGAAPEASAAPDREARENRRLARLRELGGDMVLRGERWMCAPNAMRGALAKLIDEEKAAGRPRNDSKDIRKDLAQAAAREQARKNE